MTDALFNLMKIRSEIETKCFSVGRTTNSCRLLPVAKTVSVDVLKSLCEQGHVSFGENKVQEMKSKDIALEKYLPNFEFIGHLQTNKVKDCVKHAKMIHSVDRLSLAEALDKELHRIGTSMDILIQVNTSNEESKFGVTPEEALTLVREVSKFETLKIKGLMTLAIFSDDQMKVRECFKLLKKTRNEIELAGIDRVQMNELSMGMSGDYKIAIEEGSTIVRVGTSIFGKRLTPDSMYWDETKSES